MVSIVLLYINKVKNAANKNSIIKYILLTQSLFVRSRLNFIEVCVWLNFSTLDYRVRLAIARTVA